MGEISRFEGLRRNLGPQSPDQELLTANPGFSQTNKPSRGERMRRCEASTEHVTMLPEVRRAEVSFD